MSELVRIKDLKKYYTTRKSFFQNKNQYVKAVNGVSFEIGEGETFGLVGESGCGKSTVGKTILRLCDKTDGEVIINGDDIFKLPKKELRIKRPKMQMVFQDPYSSLNPRLSVGELIGEALLDHNICKKDTLRKYVLKVMDECGLAADYIDRFPHEFSGGQRQRIGIARALALDPKFIVADEPVSALDVSIQSQIINLLMDLQKERKITYLFISHDLSIVQYISTKIGVMYLGSIVEMADKKEIFKNPLHPYTKALLASILSLDPDDKNTHHLQLEGDIPSPLETQEGCIFLTRCPYKKEICKNKVPNYQEVYKNHFAACHLIEKNHIKRKG